MRELGAGRRRTRLVAPAGADGWLAVALVVLGLGVAAIAILGPLLTNVIEYHVSDGAANQIAGGDFAGLVLVAPVSLVASGLVARGHHAGTVLALGPSVYVAYTVIQLSVGGDVTRYAGNSERFFPLFVGLLVLALAIAIRAWASFAPGDLPRTSRRLDRTVGWFALVVAMFLAVGLHLPGLVDAWADAPSGPEYLADPVVFWLVKVMDLGLVVPALVAVGWGSIRGAAWVVKARYAAVGWMAMLGTAVAGMAITMQATGDPAASVANTAAFSLFALVALSIAVAAYRPLFADAGRVT
ncbi:hypothetical protein LGT39_06100 [Demequina sp. TTPB684]|uniref:hypothetical protein n=1 Tax=unclassified Demequina TaxID=2620311 RepID=UPI001CF519B8|nr:MULTISPECIES: hypothetical protein [unclassified Demequina]MCB2412420.1 hypothetical protein [Demequina sp. TTPB684]UPU87424.1 hypothetical protein LGT36_009100 [Demequina sp. TMPB413]